MKKVFITFLIMTLVLTNISLVNISSVQAATTDKVVEVSLDNIRDLMIENNLDLKIKDNELKIAKEKYNDAKDAYTSETKPNKEDYTDIDGAYDSTGYENALAAYQAAKDAYDKVKDALKTAKTNYDQNVESKVVEAQGAYINYIADLSDKKLKEDTVKANEKKEQVYKLQYESGFISKNEYTSKLQGNTSVNDLNELKDKEQLDRTKLCNTLGISLEENIKFNTDIIVDFQMISKINYEDDLQQMLDNNTNIKLKNDAVDDLDDEDDDSDFYDYNVDNAEMNLKLAINTAETDFKGKYNDLMASYNSIKSSYDQIIQKQKEYEISQIKYDYGFISKAELDNLKTTFDASSSDFNKKRNACYLDYLKYIQMKEGY